MPLGISAAEPECDFWPLAHHNLVHAATGPASSCILRFRFDAWPRPLAFPSVATAAVLGRPCHAPSRRLQSSRPAPLVLVGLLTVQLLHRPASPRLASLRPLLIGEAGACPEPLRVEPRLRSWCAPFRCSRWLAQVRRQRPQLQRQVGLLRPCIRAHYLNLQLRSQLKRKKCTAGPRRCCRSASRNQPRCHQPTGPQARALGAFFRLPALWTLHMPANSAAVSSLSLGSPKPLVLLHCVRPRRSPHQPKSRRRPHVCPSLTDQLAASLQREAQSREAQHSAHP